jgi:hypothetical protein
MIPTYRWNNRKAPASPHTPRAGGADREGHTGGVEGICGTITEEQYLYTIFYIISYKKRFIRRIISTEAINDLV